MDIRSSAEMTIGELVILRITMESSEAIGRYVHENRPKRGSIVFGFIPLFLLYIYMECRKTTYRGVVRNLSDEDCVHLGLTDRNGIPRRPSAATLNDFVNRRLAPMTEAIGDEFAAAVLKMRPDGVNTLDSTPMEASRYNSDADFNVHYNIRMDKCHILMTDGYPLFMVRSNGSAHDNPFAADLIKRIGKVCPGYRTKEFHADGSYDSFLTYASAYIHTGAVMRCNYGTDAVYSGVDETRIIDEYAGMWKNKGFDPYKKNDTDFVLRFLYRNGKEELTGQYLRDRSMKLSENGTGKNVRHICETVHRAIKRWVDFSIFRIRKATKESRVKCRFLCVQLLSVLFRGYLGT
jgi:hypothetical protein